MGMYNVLQSNMVCPQCQGKVEWQSKHLTYDGFVLDNLLQDIPLSEHLDGEMHTWCDHCNAFTNVTIEQGEIKAGKPRKGSASSE